MRVLVVSYAFPPVGGAGVQRALKLVKYLPEHGVVPSVLTARDASVPVFDPSLLREVPRGVDVIRTRTFEPAYARKQQGWRAAASRGPAQTVRRAAVRVGRKLLTPDPQLLWQPSAQLALARRLWSRQADDVILI